METRFTRLEIGCWSDGTFGDEHLRAVLANMVPELREALRYLETCDDAIIEAIEVLQGKTDDGLYWILEAGDLILTDEIEV